LVSETRLKLQFNYSNRDLEIISDYLNEKEKKSDGSYRNAKSIVYRCLNYIGKPLEQIKYKDGKDYLRSLERNKNVKPTSKDTYRSYLRFFFEFVKYALKEEGIEFSNPIPPKRFFAFSLPEIENKPKVEAELIFKQEDLRELLHLSLKRKLRDFIIFGILTFTGMRISECLTIKIEYIDTNKRKISTGFVKGARKTYSMTGKGLEFFIPRSFAIYLDHYIALLGTEIGFLFPGREKGTHYAVQSWRNQVKKYYGKFRLLHSFRRTLITKRLSMGCPLYISMGLMNHHSGIVQVENYWKLSDDEKLALYDKYNPFPNLL